MVCEVPDPALCGAPDQAQTDMEEVFLSLGLDIIGLGVFNYDFKSITKESPVIKARSRCAAAHACSFSANMSDK